MNNNSIIFRHTTATDEEFLFQLYASTRQEELAPVNWSESEKKTFLRQQFFYQSKFYEEHYQGDAFLVIKRDGCEVGRLYKGDWPKEIRIIDISLLPQYRNQGIGSAILGDILAQARVAGKCVRIHVEKNNPARTLYQRLGFVVIDDKGVYDLMEWSTGDTDSDQA